MTTIIDQEECKLRTSSTSSEDGRWNSKIEGILKTIGEYCRCYAWLHKKTADTYAKKHKIMSTISIAFKTLIGTTMFSTLNHEDFWIRAFAASTITVTTIIQSLSEFHLKYAERVEKNISIRERFMRLSNTISNELNIPRKTRQDSNTFTQYINKKFADLKVEAPHIPSKIKAEYLNFSKMQPNIFKAEIVAEIEPIFIRGDTPTPPLQQNIILEKQKSFNIIDFVFKSIANKKENV